VTQHHVDHIIVGGGSAGCVLAKRLSEDPRVQVCLLEAGPDDRHPSIHIPMGMLWLMRSKRLNWQFHTAEESGLAGRRLFWPRGRMLGGSSGMNAMLYTRGHRYDYDLWASLGNRDWSYEDVLPWFRKSERQVRGADAFHGADGELHVTDPLTPHLLTRTFIDAAVSVGHPFNNDFNGAEQEGVGVYQLTQVRGRRCSAAKAFLTPDVRQRPNLRIVTGAHVTRVMLSGSRAVGVEYVQGGRTQVLHANGEVILSAGAIQSPHLLMLSGIGDASQLQQHGIACVHDLPGVGRNLQDHLDLTLTHRCLKPVSAGLTWRNGLRGPWDAMVYAARGSGTLASNGAEGAGFIKSSPEEAIPDLQLHFMPAALRDHGRDLRYLGQEGYTMHVCQLRPKSVGRIRLHSANPADAPVIEANYLSHPDDLQTLIKGVRRAREIFASSVWEGLRGEELAPGPAHQTDAELADYIRAHAETIYHPVGTCKMGHDPLAVVNDRLQVHGIEGLRVADASIMPTLVGGNTNAPSIMIGERAAAWVQEGPVLR
jgi:choline dehydrogenase-like flavoprotein